MSNTLQQAGKIILINATQQVSDKFKKREFVLETYEDVNGQTYTNFAKFQTTQNKCDILDRFKVNDMVNVSFNIKGNKWERDGKVNYISNLDAWRVEAVGGTQQQRTPQQSYNQPAQSNAAPASAPDNIESLPF